MLRSLVTVESGTASLPPPPAKAVARTYPAVPQRDDSLELDRLARPATAPSEPEPDLQPLRPNPDDLESSRPTTPAHSSANPSRRNSTSGIFADGVEAVRQQDISDPPMNRLRLLAACLMGFTNGLNDSAPGPLIPYMERYFNVGYGTVALIFVGNALGFVAAALVLDALRARLGAARALAVAQTLMALGYVPIVCHAPFPALVCGFFLVGVAAAINVTIGNLFCGGLRRATAALGAMHGSYGIGGTIGPLVATALVSAAGVDRWADYYFITLALAVCTCVFSTWAFWGYEDEQDPSNAVGTAPGREQPADAAVPGRRVHQMAGMLTAMASRVVALGALFIFAYQGAEVSISGWVISFLIAARHGDPSTVGFVTAGFWAGITLGRFALSGPVAALRLGERKSFVYAVVAGAAVFEALVWGIPNVLGDAISVAIVGLLLGPVYPCAVNTFMRSLGRRERLNGMGVISAFGSAGGAAAPFVTGILAQAVGTFVLHPIAISLFGVMLACWFFIPSPRKRTE